MCTLGYIQWTPEYITAFSTVVLAVITLYYAIVTNSILKQNKELNDSTFRPYVFIQPYFERGSTLVFLKISNLGKTTAKDLSIIPVTDFYIFNKKEKNINNLLIFNKTIKDFPPSSEVMIHLENCITLFSDESINPRELVFDIRYSSSYGETQYTERVSVSLDYYKETPLGSESIEKKLENIKKVLENIKDKLNK